MVLTLQRVCRHSLIAYGGRVAARLLVSLLIFILIGSGAVSGPVFAADASIDAFFGTYEGTAYSSQNAASTPRDIRVSIHPHGKGFNVAWATTKSDGERKSYSINFEATTRPGIYGSAMRRNMFGDSVPLDPLKGDPYVWARINDQTLTVYGFVITPEGSYDMQVYHRTLSEDGLELEFFRYLEGQPVRRIKGTLVKVEE